MADEKRGSNKGLVVLLCLLLVVIVGLGVGLVFVFNGNDNIDEVVAEYDPVKLVVDEIDTIGNPTVEQIVDIYQKYIDSTDNLKLKVDLLRSRIISVQEIDLYYGGGELMINDAIAIDDILQSIDSAVGVINVANTYGNNELSSRYGDILKNRQIKQGINVNMETKE